MNDSPTALVVGVTGIAGSAVADLLVARGRPVLGLSRRAPAPRPGAFGALFDRLEADRVVPPAPRVGLRS